jgi:Domain of unknown function (DUF222)
VVSRWFHAWDRVWFCRGSAIAFEHVFERRVGSEAITAAFDRLDAAIDEVAALSFDALTTPERLALLERSEVLRRRQPAAEHRLPHVAQRGDRRRACADHRRFVDELPAAVDHETGIGARKRWCRWPAMSTRTATSATSTARRRYLTVGTQGVDGMSKITGLLDPEARATLDAVLAELAPRGARCPGTGPRRITPNKIGPRAV